MIYWVSGVAGAALSCRLGHYTSVGASGAVLGLVGAGIVLSRGQALPAEDRAELGRPMIFWLAATLVVGWLQPHIDQWAHLGGTACGAFLALSVRPGPAGPWRRGLERALAAGVMLAVLVSTGVMIRATRSDDVERRQVFALGVSLETPAQWLTRRSLPDLVEFGAPGVSARIRLRRTWLDRQLPVAQEPRLLQAAVGRMHLVAGPTRIDLPDGRHVWWVRVWPQEVVDCYAWFRDDQVVEVIGLAPPDRIRHYESLFRRAAESVRPL